MPSTDGEESRRELKQKAARERRIREGEEDPGGRPGSDKLLLLLLLLLSAVSFFWRTFPSTLFPGYTSIYTNGDSESSPGGIPALVLDPAEAVGLAPARVPRRRRGRGEAAPSGGFWRSC